MSVILPSIYHHCARNVSDHNFLRLSIQTFHYLFAFLILFWNITYNKQLERPPSSGARIPMIVVNSKGAKMRSCIIFGEILHASDLIVV